MRQSLVTENALKMETLEGVKSESAEKEKQMHLDSYRNLPMPSERQEAWRYTNIGKFSIDSFAPFGNEAAIGSSNTGELAEKGIILTGINDAFESHPELIK